MNIRNLFGAVSLIIAVGLSPHSSAQGQVLAVATLEGTYSQPVNNSSWQAIHVSAAGTALQFNTANNNDRVVIAYSASCLALGFVVYVRAKVDGVIANPGATSGVPLCSVAVSGSTYPASRTFSALIPAKGAHNVTLEVKGSGAAINIGDSALVVQR